MPISQLDQQLLDAAKQGRNQYEEVRNKIQNDFYNTYKNINSYDFKQLLGKTPTQEVDYGGGYKLRRGADYTQGGAGGSSTSWNTFDLVDAQGNVVQNIRHTDSKSTMSQIKNAITQKFGTGFLNAGSFNDRISYLNNLAQQAGDTTFSKTGVKGYWDKQYKEQRAKIDAQDYGTFIAPQTGKQVVMHTPEDLKNALVLGFKKVKDGTTPLKGEEINMISEAATTGSKLQANLDAYLKANPPVQGVQQTYDPKTGKTTYGDGATYSIASATQPMGDAVYRVNGKLMSAEAAKAAGVDITKLTPESGSAYVDKVGTTSTPTSTSSTTTPTGTIPGMKNIFTDKKDVLANDAMVNQLFKAYHGRDANLQELNYWRTKKIGDLENTLAKTQIFSKEDADKIRAQMQAEGKTYIANQAELEQLAQAGKITPAGLTSVSQQGGMLFQGTPTTTSGGTGTGGAGTGTGGATGTGGTGVGTGGTGTGTATDGATGEDALIETIANAVGDPNAADTDILAALNNVKNSQIDPYYKQLISQAQKDVMTSINRQYEDRIRQLQTESFNMAENIKNTQKSLEQSGMTFSGKAIEQLGTLAAFGQSTPAGLTPAQLGQTGQQMSGGTPVQNQTLPQTAVGLPTMTAEQMGLEGSVNMQNRLYSESSRNLFNRGLEDTGQAATRLLGTQGVQNLGLPSQAIAGQPQTTGTMQYDYANTLQNTYGNLAAQEGNLTDYQKLFL